MTLEWDIELANFSRGNALEAATMCGLDRVLGPLREMWRKVIEIADAFQDNGKLGVLVEVWPDTGRVIFRLSDRREFARVILNIHALERRYYELATLSDEEFEEQHEILINSMLNATSSCLKPGVRGSQNSEIAVVGRSSDDKDTTLPLTANHVAAESAARSST